MNSYKLILDDTCLFSAILEGLYNFEKKNKTGTLPSREYKTFNDFSRLKLSNLKNNIANYISKWNCIKK